MKITCSFVSGILDIDDKTADDGPEDEILIELKRKQQELKVLSQHNLMLTKQLYKMAKDQIQKQELRKKMAVADAEVGSQTLTSPTQFHMFNVLMYNE